MPTVVIDCFPEHARRYRGEYAVVAVDVVRATTTAVTAVMSGRRCLPVPSLDAATELARSLDGALLAGELGGRMPYEFDLNNSPVEVARRTDVWRPLVLLSTSGTRLFSEALGARCVYAACLRNHRAQALELAGRYEHVAIVGAGARGDFREDDQLCCAWIAESLVESGYRAADEATAALVRRWSGASTDAIARGKSADYLRESGQVADLEFILEHVDDVDAVFPFDGVEVHRHNLGGSAERPRRVSAG